MKNIQTKVIWKGEEFVGLCNKLEAFDCDQKTSGFKDAWLAVREGAVIQYELTFENPNTMNSLQGVWASVNGQGVLLDVISVANAVAACNACCDEPVAIIPRYDGTYPAYFNRVATTYTMTSVDYGDGSAFEDFSLKYMKYIITNTLLRTAYDAGTSTSTYTFSSYTDPVPQGTDAVTGETARVFDSNAPGAFTGTNDTYLLSTTADGIVKNTVSATTLALLVTAATGNTALAALGTWTQSGGKMHLTSTVVYGAVLVVTQYEA